MATPNDARFWDKISKKYARQNISDPEGYELTLQRIRELLNPNDKVLELGCGTGTSALKLAASCETYLATDISPEMIAIAKSKAAESAPSGLEFQVGTADTVSTDDGPFHAIIGLNYIHLVRDIPATLTHIRDLLGPGGLLITKTPCLGDMTPLIRLVLLPVLQAIGKAPFVASLRSTELERLITDAGFEIVAKETHASNGKAGRPFIAARKR